MNERIRLTAEQTRLVQVAHADLDAGSRGKTGLRTMTDARRTIRSLLGIIDELTGQGATDTDLPFGGAA